MIVALMWYGAWCGVVVRFVGSSGDVAARWLWLEL